VPGRGGRENEVLAPGEYGEYPGCVPYRPEKVDEVAVEAIRTGVKMRVDMSLDKDEGRSAAKSSKKLKHWNSVIIRDVDVWDMMEKAGIEVERKPDEICGRRK
jgi:hypothetical protein